MKGRIIHKNKVILPLSILFLLLLCLSFWFFKDSNIGKGHTLGRALLEKQGALVYDVQALPLISTGEEFYFYPLYTDAVVLIVDKEQLETSPSGWESLKDFSSLKVSLPDEEPERSLVWMAISHALGGEFKQKHAVDYLQEIKKGNPRLAKDEHAPLQIDFASHGYRQKEEGRDVEIIIPEEGSLSFEVGMTSFQPLPENELPKMKKEYSLSSSLLYPAAKSLKEVNSFGEVQTSLSKQIFNVNRYVPLNYKENLLSFLVLMCAIAFLMVQSQKLILHEGIRKGLFLTCMLLIGWCGLTLFKYSLKDQYHLIRICWYLYYCFILSLPLLSLYIAQNVDNYESSYLSPLLRINTVIAIIFIIMVLTNNLHQFVFGFHSSDPVSWNKEYSYELGYYILTIWFIVSQFGAFYLMQKKGFDSPRRYRTIPPFLVFLGGILYSALYNLQISPIREFSLTMGMSTFVLLFWGAAIVGGLIPSNRGYFQLFKNSNLDIQIFDPQGSIAFQSANATPLPELKQKKDFLSKDTLSLISENHLLWSTPINGGAVITKEDISLINILRSSLQETTDKLEEENRYLCELEEIRSDLILAKEQNILTSEVNKILEAKLSRLQKILDNQQPYVPIDKKTLTQIHRLVLYCKRRSELLIRAKQENTLPLQELSRILQEVTVIISPDYSFICQSDGSIPLSIASTIYEFYHLLLDIACESVTPVITTILRKKGQLITLNLLIDGESERLYRAIKQIILENSWGCLSKKDLDGTLSLTISFEEGGF